MKWLIAFMLLIAGCHVLCAQGAAGTRELRIRELEGVLKPLENPDVDAFVAYLSHYCHLEGEWSMLQPPYQASVIEEANLLASGLGENHPRIKAVRERKELLAKYIADFRVKLRNKIAAQLEELRK